MARDHPTDLHFDTVRQPPVLFAGPPLAHLVVMRKACAGIMLLLLHERTNTNFHVPGRKACRPVASGFQRLRPIQEPPFVRVGLCQQAMLSNQHGARDDRPSILYSSRCQTQLAPLFMRRMARSLTDMVFVQ